MEEELTIEGERFLGKFKVCKRTREVFRGGEYVEANYADHWYEGAGLIKDKVLGRAYFFYLVTYRQYRNHTLEEGLVDFDPRWPCHVNSRVIVVEGMYKTIIDLSLRDMVSQVESSTEDLPTVYPLRGDLDDLVARGCVVINSSAVSE
ncbi:MAG: hypothetical protein ACE5DM_04530 [Candidatus Nanoarchaeia archaeon]